MKFIESTHEYIENNRKFFPVTYLLHYFQEFVDWDAECKKKALKMGISFEELKAQWDKKRDDAALRGTAFHKKKEDEYNLNGAITMESVSFPVVMMPTINDVKEDGSMKLQDNTIYTEKMIWSNTYGVCGTADLVEVKDRKIHIKDYKTNAKLETSSYKHPTKGSKKFKSPINALDDCNFNLYQLQINLYMYMLLQQNRNLKMGDMTILHVTFDEHGEPKGMIPYKVKDLQKAAYAMLETFKAKKKI